MKRMLNEIEAEFSKLTDQKASYKRNLALVDLMNERIVYMTYLNSEIKEDIIDALNFTINSGYYDNEEILEITTEYLEEIFAEYELSLPTEEEVKKIIGEIRLNIIDHSNYKRLQEVFDQLNCEGIISIDFAGFDISEGHEEVGEVFEFMKKNDLSRKGYCFYHQQDIERSMDFQFEKLFLAFNSLDGDEEKASKIGTRIVDLLVQVNFDVEWDGSLNQRICIQNFKWDKKFDAKLVSTERAIEIIRNYNGL